MDDATTTIGVPGPAWAAARALECGSTSTDALAHLLTPVQVMVGAQVRIAAGHVQFRAGRCPVGRSPLATARNIHRMMLENQKPSDLFLADTARGPELLTATRSGAQILLAGSRELFGAPHVEFSTETLTPGSLSLLVDLVASGRLPIPDGEPVVLNAHVALLGDRYRVVVVPHPDVSP